MTTNCQSMIMVSRETEDTSASRLILFTRLVVMHARIQSPKTLPKSFPSGYTSILHRHKGDYAAKFLEVVNEISHMYRCKILTSKSQH